MHHFARYSSTAAIAALVAACAGTDTSAPKTFAATATSNPALTVAGEEGEFAGSLLLADEFSRAPINRLKWRVTTDIPQGQAQVFVDGGRATLLNRGYLVTLAEFSPREMGGIRVTGEWTFGDAGDDMLQILTRSNGRPDPANVFGETGQGIEFFAAQLWGDANIMRIIGRGGADGSITDLSTPGLLVLTSGKTYRFDIRDDGRNLRFTLSDILDPSQSRTVTARSLYAGESNHVAFHNREYYCCSLDRRSFLDNIRIERKAR